jgi:hypothetical protein
MALRFAFDLIFEARQPPLKGTAEAERLAGCAAGQSRRVLALAGAEVRSSPVWHRWPRWREGDFGGRRNGFDGAVGDVRLGTAGSSFNGSTGIGWSMPNVFSHARSRSSLRGGAG